MSEMPPWSTLVPDTRAFLDELAQNNSRDWFNSRKPEYEARLKAPALALLDAMSAELEQQTGTLVTSKLWRPHRDVRFSKDKTPYHLHLHLGWSSDSGAFQTLAWFFGIAPGYVCAGGGAMGFDKPTLDNWRKAVDGSAGKALQTEIDALLARKFRIDDPELKRVPAPFDKEHPRGELLRRKGLVLWSDWDGAELQPWLSEVFSALSPLMTQLAGMIRR